MATLATPRRPGTVSYTHLDVYKRQGKSLKLPVVAEGIETSQQNAFLQSLHCEEGQGHYFSRPVAAETFAGLLKT